MYALFFIRVFRILMSHLTKACSKQLKNKHGKGYIYTLPAAFVKKNWFENKGATRDSPEIALYRTRNAPRE